MSSHHYSATVKFQDLVGSSEKDLEKGLTEILREQGVKAFRIVNIERTD